MGLTEGSVLRVFFICGAFTGVIGTVLGVILGCLFAIYIDQVFSFVNYIVGGGDVWDPAVRGIYQLPAELRLEDVLKAVSSCRLRLVLCCDHLPGPPRGAHEPGGGAAV